jgi:hypothetical protein
MNILLDALVVIIIATLVGVILYYAFFYESEDESLFARATEKKRALRMLAALC